MQRTNNSWISAVTGAQADSWVDGLFSMECILPVQINERRASRSGEERLLLAVLKDAINSYLGEEPQARIEASRWIKDSSCSHPFTFENICDVFGLDSGWLRQRLLKQRAMLAEEPSSFVAPRNFWRAA